MSFQIKSFHFHIYFFALSLLAIGLPFSNFLMSISQLILLGNWILEGNLKEKSKQFFQNKTALVFSSVFIIHLLGLLYTTDFVYGLEDIRKKIPLLLLPLIISTSKPLSEIWFKRLLAVFVASVAIATVVCSFVLFGFTTKEIIDVREISIFISHIRFSLMICLAFFISLYYGYKQRGAERLMLLILSFWFIVFLILMQSLTGIIITTIILFFLILYQTFNIQHSTFKIPLILILLLFPMLSFFYIKNEIQKFQQINPIDLLKLEEFSKGGEKYFHDTTRTNLENGNYIWIYIAREELKNSWNKKSSISIDSTDEKQQLVYSTLIRFLTSKGLKKDAEGINSLSNDEVKSIENGVANVNFQHSNFNTRVQQILWEINSYKSGETPNGHSLTMRFEFWKIAIGIIKENLFFGVGTGDVKISFEEEYKKTNSSLSQQWRLRAHNQFLEIAVALGIFGLMFFLFSLISPFIFNRKKTNYFYVVFFTIAAFSMFSEDTLETQAGVTFFAFFNCLLLFGREGKN